MRRLRREKSEKTIQGKEMTVLKTVLVLAGIWGILLAVGAVPGISFSEEAVLGEAGLLCAFLCSLFLFQREWVLKAAAGTCLACVLAGFIGIETVRVQAGALLMSLADASAETETDVTYVMLLITAVLSVCFFLLEIVWKHHLLPGAVVMGVLAGAPVFGISLGAAPILLGLVFQILLWTVQGTERQRKQMNHGKKIKRRMTGRGFAFMGTVLSILVCVSLVLTSVWGQEISRLVYAGEGFFLRNAQQIAGRANDPAADGRISSGNNYRTGEPQLEVTLQEKPTETLYLKGFTGGNYIGGEWEPADDRSIFHEMALALNWEKWESWIRSVYYSLYFSVNEMTAEEPVQPGTIFLKHVSNEYHTMYVPYYSRWITQRESFGLGYGFNYYREEELDIRWDNVPKDYEMARDWYRAVQNAYMEEIPDAYVQVSEEELPKLTELCRNNPLDSLDQVTAFILTVLQSHASYTLTPGRAPFNEDIVEYFLFDSHKGYCVHFASAAALMYRLYGIPARYASGYALQPSDFVQQEDGTWTLEVTDESAHAWTEIFLEDYGWTPVEVTPASDGSYSTSYPGLDTEGLEELISTMNLNRDISEESGETEETVQDTGKDRQEGFSADSWEFRVDWERYHDFILVAGTVLAESLVLLPLFLDYRRLRRRKKLEQMSCRKVFGRFMDMVHFAGYLTGCSGTEADFSEKMAEELPCITLKEAERLVMIVSCAAYGKKGADEEENAFVRKIYFCTGEWLTGEIRGFRKLYFRYFKAFY